MKLILLKTIPIKAAIIKIVLFIGLEYVFLFLSFFLIAVRKKLKNKIYISRLINECRFKFISDEKFALKKFKKRKGYKLDLKNPQTFTEKLQFLKLYYRNPLMSICADKYYAREYVKLCGYESILKEIYGVYNDVDEIDLALLPKDFFIHWNHMSGGNYIIRNGKIEKNIIELLAEYKKINWYHQGREWQYNYIRPKYILNFNILFYLKFKSIIVLISTFFIITFS